MVKLISLFVSLLFCSGITNAATFTTSVDRKELTIDEHLLLTFSLFNSDTRLRAQGVSPNIDLTLLNDEFHVGTPRENHNYNVFRSRGRATSELVVELFPKRSGTLHIPYFEIEGIKSTPLSITVKPSSYGDAPLAFSRSGVNKTSLWQGEELIVYVDVYYRVALESAKLDGDIETEPTPLDLFPHSRLLQSQRDEKINGFTYQIMRSSWAVFPNVSDELRISIPATWIATKDGKKLRLPQQQETINIKPLPQNTPKNIIIGKPKINVSPLRVTNQVNELSSWRYTITAAAPSTVFSQKLALPPIPQVRLFTDRVTLTANEEQGILNHVAEYTISAMPLAPGSYTLLPIDVSYFDPDTGRLSSIRQESITLSAIATTNQLNTSLSIPETMMSLPNREKNSFTQWRTMTLGITFLWLTTSVLLIWQLKLAKKILPRIEKENAATPPIKSSSRPLEKQLLDALNSRSLEQGLKQWENTHGTDIELRNTIRSVQTLYYGQQQKPSNEKKLTAQVSRFIEKRRNQPRKPAHQHDEWSPRAFTQPPTDEK